MNPANIMIVESDPNASAELKNRLESIGHRVVGAASSGEDALAKAESRTPEVILTETRLAGELDGIETALQIRERLRRKTAVIFLTAHSGDDMVERAKAVDPCGYLLKPCSPDQLRIAITLCLHAARKSEGKRAVHDGKSRILVMDDEEMVRDVLKMALGRFGYEATLTVEGGQAVECYRNAMASGEPFDAVIVDLEISLGMDGVEAIRRLREVDPAVTAIAHSGSLNHPAMIDCRKYGFAAALQKPCSLKELRGMLSKVLRFRAPEGAST